MSIRGRAPAAGQGDLTPRQQIERLARVIQTEIEVEPSSSEEGAVDAAIRLLRAAYDCNEHLSYAGPPELVKPSVVEPDVVNLDAAGPDVVPGRDDSNEHLSYAGPPE